MSETSGEQLRSNSSTNAGSVRGLNENSPTNVVNVSNSKPGFYDLNGIEPVETNPTSPPPVAYKRGWKSTVDRKKAIADTLAEVAKLYPGRAVMGDPEIVESDEHKRAKEYLVKVVVV